MPSRQRNRKKENNAECLQNAKEGEKEGEDGKDGHKYILYIVSIDH